MFSTAASTVGCSRSSARRPARASHRYECQGLSLLRQGLGDPHHRAPVKDDPKIRGSILDDLSLDISRRYEMKESLQLVTRQYLRVPRLSYRRWIRERLSVEVKEFDLGPPARHAPCGHRRIDPTRQERQHAPGHAGGKPTGTRYRLRKMMQALPNSSIQTPSHRSASGPPLLRARRPTADPMAMLMS